MDSSGDSCNSGTEGEYWQVAALVQPEDEVQPLGEWQALLTEHQPGNSLKCCRSTSGPQCAWPPAATACRDGGSIIAM